MRKVAIVGSEGKYWDTRTTAKAIIEIDRILDEWCSEWGAVWSNMVSGGCPKGGVDIWAEEVAKHHGMGVEVYSAKSYDWDGYRSRNIEVAESCDVLYCIDPKGRSWSGGRWTLAYAEALGKEVHLVEI